MGLLDFFKQKPAGPSVRTLSWIDKQGKWNGCLKLVAENPDAVVISWFPHTAEEFIRFAAGQNHSLPEIKDAHRVMAMMVENKTVIFLEHYPLLSKEENLLQHWNAKTIYVLLSMDEPLMLHAGGEKIADLMRKMGQPEDEPMEHSLISKSIRKLQMKIEKAISSDDRAYSTEEWLRKSKLEGGSFKF